MTFVVLAPPERLGCPAAAARNIVTLRPSQRVTVKSSRIAFVDVALSWRLSVRGQQRGAPSGLVFAATVLYLQTLKKNERDGASSWFCCISSRRRYVEQPKTAVLEQPHLSKSAKSEFSLDQGACWRNEDSYLFSGILPRCEQEGRISSYKSHLLR
jgi:hypothetical protein